MRFKFKIQDQAMDFRELFMLFSDKLNWDQMCSDLTQVSIEYSINLNTEDTYFKKD